MQDRRVTTFVFDFAQGNRDQKDLLGGKGANLAEMTNLGLPVPPGFTISTVACTAYLAEGREPEALSAEISEHLLALEKAMGRPWVTRPIRYWSRCDPAPSSPCQA